MRQRRNSAMPSDGWFAAMALPAQIAPEIDNVRSDAANEMAVGNDLTALGYAGAPRTRARCHATAHATVMGAAVHGNAVLGGLTVWHPGATIGANAQASTVFMGAGRVLRLCRSGDHDKSRIRGRSASGGAGHHRAAGGLVIGYRCSCNQPHVIA